MDTSAPVSTDTNGVSVLVVDDDVANRLLAVRWLERVGLQTCQAETGEAALAELRKDPRKIGAVLLDVMMPGMSGYEVLATMQSDPELRPVPVVMLTAHAQQERDVVHGLRSGAVDHLFKPFRGPVLAEKMRALLRSRQLHLQMQSQALVTRSDSDRDADTGLCGRSEFLEQLESEAAFAERHCSPLSLFLLEVDAPPQAVVAALAASCRISERPFLLKPQRFAILLRGADTITAQQAERRIVAAIEAVLPRVAVRSASLPVGAQALVDGARFLREAESMLAGACPA